MADDSTRTKNTTEDAIILLIGLLIVANLLQNINERIQTALGIGPPEVAIAEAYDVVPLTFSTPNGSLARTVADTTFFGEPGGGAGEEGGEIPEGSLLSIIGGPETVDGVRWWKVAADTDGDGVPDTEGWVRDEDMEGLAERTEGDFVEERFRLGSGTSLGTRVAATEDASVRSMPGNDGVVLGVLPVDGRGTIVDGPETADGVRWWKVAADTDGDGVPDTEGWVREDELEGYAYRKPQRSGIWGALTGRAELSDTTPHGTPVEFVEGADLLSSAGRGIVLGFVPEGVRGILSDGPEKIGEERWWQVEVEEYEPGWVSERVLKSASVLSWVKVGIMVVVVLGSVLSLALLGALAYVTLRTNQIRVGEKRIIDAASMVNTEQRRNERWERILDEVSSGNPNDWRQAIIDSDIILDELISRMGYRGATIGDKLKQIERSDFTTLDQAWAAHKVRNRIAHDGSDYILTQREARRVIDLYAEVFREFKYI